MNTGIRSFVAQLEMLNVWALLKMKTERWIITVRVCEKLSKAKSLLKRLGVGSKLSV